MLALFNAVPVTVLTDSRQWPSLEVPDGFTRAMVRLGRQTTATPTLWARAATVVTLQVELSVDAGVTWELAAAFTAPGGLLVGRSGELAESFISCPLRLGLNRQLRVRVNVTNGPLRSILSVEVE